MSFNPFFQNSNKFIKNIGAQNENLLFQRSRFRIFLPAIFLCWSWLSTVFVPRENISVDSEIASDRICFEQNALFSNSFRLVSCSIYHHHSPSLSRRTSSGFRIFFLRSMRSSLTGRVRLTGDGLCESFSLRFFRKSRFNFSRFALFSRRCIRYK